jgi:hypothetical protein
VPLLAVSKKLLPQSYPDGEADSKSPPRGPNRAALAGASTGPDYRRLTFPQICDIKNQSTHSNIMKHIIAFLLKVAFLGFSIVTGRAEQPPALPSGTYYLSLTPTDSKDAKDEVKNLPVRLTTTKGLGSVSSGAMTVIQTDIVMESDNLRAKFEGATNEQYSEGKLTRSDIFLVGSRLMPRTGTPQSYHLKGTVSNHSAGGEGALFENLSKQVQLKWTLTNQPQE